MRKLPITLFLVAALAATWGCKSQRHTPPEYDPDQVPCICGEPEARLDGCPHPLCINGEGNPDNLECVCGSIFDEEDN